MVASRRPRAPWVRGWCAAVTLHLAREPWRPAGCLGWLAEAPVATAGTSEPRWEPRTRLEAPALPGGSASLRAAFALELPVPSVRGFLSGANDSALANGLSGP